MIFDPRLDAVLALGCLALSLWERRRAQAGRHGAGRWAWFYLIFAVGFGAFALSRWL